MKKVLCFGELLLRICPDADGEWLKENQLPFYVGGAELNVATALALWNIPTAYFTALPANFMAEQLIAYMDNRNIDTASINKSGDRIGLYYLTKGKDLKHDAVIYDRANSSFAKLKTKTINWDEVLKDVSWFHFSAICPALNQDAADICLEVLKAAKDRHIKISIDLNYRAKLWTYGKEPIEIIPELAKYADLIMGNVWAADKMLGISVDADIEKLDKKDVYLQQAEKTSKAIMLKFPACQSVANTFRFDNEGGIKYYTTLFVDDQMVVSKTYQSPKIIDKVGSGDCFMAGLIYGFYHKKEPQHTLEFATAAAFNKLFIPSDCTTSTVNDIEKIIQQHES